MIIRAHASNPAVQQAVAKCVVPLPLTSMLTAATSTGFKSLLEQGHGQVGTASFSVLSGRMHENLSQGITWSSGVGPQMTLSGFRMCTHKHVCLYPSMHRLY